MLSRHISKITRGTLVKGAFYYTHAFGIKDRSPYHFPANAKVVWSGGDSSIARGGELKQTMHLGGVVLTHYSEDSGLGPDLCTYLTLKHNTGKGNRHADYDCNTQLINTHDRFVICSSVMAYAELLFTDFILFKLNINAHKNGGGPADIARACHVTGCKGGCKGSMRESTTRLEIFARPYTTAGSTLHCWWGTPGSRMPLLCPTAVKRIG